MEVHQDGARDGSDASARNLGRRGIPARSLLALGTLAIAGWWWIDADRPGLPADPPGLAIPEDGEVAADHLDDGTPVFVSHLDGEVEVLDARLPGPGPDADGRLRRLVGYCPSSGGFEDPAHGSVFGRDGRWNGGPAPGSLARFRAEVGDARVHVEPEPQLRDRPGRSTTTTRPPRSGPSCADLPPAETGEQLLAHTPGDIAPLRRVDRHDWGWVDVRFEPADVAGTPDGATADDPPVHACDGRDCVGTFTIPGWRPVSGPVLAQIDGDGELRLLLPAIRDGHRSRPTTSGA